MKVLVTGSQGGIGRRLMSHLGPEAIGLDRSEGADLVADLGTIDYTGQPICQVLRQVRAVIHLAGPSDPEEEAPHHFAAVTNTARLLEACAAAGVPKVLLASSDWAEPKDPALEINAYGYSKRVIESLAAFYSSAPGLQAVALRIGWVPANPSDVGRVPEWIAKNYWSDERLCSEVDRILSEAIYRAGPEQTS